MATTRSFKISDKIEVTETKVVHGEFTDNPLIHRNLQTGYTRIVNHTPGTLIITVETYYGKQTVTEEAVYHYDPKFQKEVCKFFNI